MENEKLLLHKLRTAKISDLTNEMNKAKLSEIEITTLNHNAFDIYYDRGLCRILGIEYANPNHEGLVRVAYAAFLELREGFIIENCRTALESAEY